MKKILLSLAALVVMAPSTVSAIEDSPISFGIDIAPAITWLGMGSHPEVESDGSKMKFNAGVDVYYSFGSDYKYSIYTGLNYNNYGGWLKGDIAATAAEHGKEATATSERAKYNFSELELPIGVRFRTGNFGKFRFAAHINLGIAAVLYGHATMGGHDYMYGDRHIVHNSYDKESYEYSPMRVRGTFGIAIGAEYNLLDAVVLTAKLRYKGSITNMYFYNSDDTNMSNPSATLDLKNSDDNFYSDPVTFRPHIFELVLGVLF